MLEKEGLWRSTGGETRKGLLEARLVGEVLTLMDGEEEPDPLDDADRRVEIDGSLVVWAADGAAAAAGAGGFAVVG